MQKCLSARFYLPAGVTTCTEKIVKVQKRLLASFYLPARVEKVQKCLSATFSECSNLTGWAPARRFQPAPPSQPLQPADLGGAKVC